MTTSSLERVCALKPYITRTAWQDKGTAGATIAARIAEDPSVTVAVLEAGDNSVENNPLAFIPGTDALGIGSDPL